MIKRLMIGELCELYRKYYLKMSRREFCDRTGSVYANITAFESGKSRNVEYLKHYYDATENKDDWKDFMAYMME